MSHTSRLGQFVFVPSIQRHRQRQAQKDIRNPNGTNMIERQDFDAVSSETVGSFSSPDRVFIPLFVPDIRKLDQLKTSSLFEPFSFSVNL